MFIQAFKDVFALARLADESPRVQYIGKHGVKYARRGD